ncbi:MAG: tyrosine-type recombinase/integrase [Deltaproteobacteria bacterium]|nr:tyrosine-type recombinase/integrase [Deltaproteobacteria bacterium]
MRGIDSQHTDVSSEHFTLPTNNSFESYPTRVQSEPYSDSSIEALHKILRRLAGMDLPGKEHVEAYLRHVVRRNRRPLTLYSIMGSIALFLGMIRDSGKKSLADITKGDVEAFIEHEQDRGIKITTIRTRLMGVHAFLRYLVEEGIVSPDVFGRRIRLKMPDTLPRAMDPDDVWRLLSVIDNTRDRAMILVLLRTGMRIGELLNTKMVDVHLRERRIELYEGEKNRMGRVVYLSDDAVRALRLWLKERDPWKAYLIYGRSRGRICYSTARSRVVKYLVKAGLSHKGYTVHTLRHTFATELLNAGMRLECLQVLLGHRCIEETRRYARLTDKTREAEYFKAMSRIERRQSDGDDRHNSELEAIFEKEELCTQYR